MIKNCIQLMEVMSDVLRSPTGLDVSNIALCSHEQAETRLILNSADAVLKCHRRVRIRTVDTDLLVLLLAVASFDKSLMNCGLSLALYHIFEA